VSFQIASLKILSSYPAGKASLADLKRDLAILTTSGPDWAARMKRLAALAPDLDAFSQGFIERDNEGWSITAAGRAFLEALERPLPETDAIEPVVDVSTTEEVAPIPPALKIVGRRDRKPRRRRANLARLSA
jgi:hypothetical protein